ncbi:unnamed protein product [Caenorhabditis auriculariae]|uniref:SET domain-containing protein n=1 Tax=Caenorhabditis auriculariae TaxID=2777116 RepID=A0A8S1GY14_9PELO|nr:unnamed protein product [Caenorhabditis auriculariae]
MSARARIWPHSSMRQACPAKAGLTKWSEGREGDEPALAQAWHEEMNPPAKKSRVSAGHRGDRIRFFDDRQKNLENVKPCKEPYFDTAFERASTCDIKQGDVFNERSPMSFPREGLPLIKMTNFRVKQEDDFGQSWVQEGIYAMKVDSEKRNVSVSLEEEMAEDEDDDKENSQEGMVSPADIAKVDSRKRKIASVESIEVVATSDETVEFPFKQRKKFTKEDESKLNYGNFEYEVQALYNTGNDCSWAYVYWLEWQPNTGSEVDLEKLGNCGDKIEELRERNSAFDAIEENLKAKNVSSTYRRLAISAKTLPKNENFFWHLADIEYEHRKSHSTLNVGNIHYANWYAKPVRRGRLLRTFDFKYISKSELSPEAVLYLRSSERRSMNQKNCSCISKEQLARLENMDDATRIENITLKSCADVSTCVDRADGDRSPCGNFCGCLNDTTMVEDERVDQVQFLHYDADGRLGMPDVLSSKVLIAVECTDHCGCGPSCHTKVVQNGSKQTLVLFYENPETGWGVRAAADIRKGDFVTEYLGKIVTEKEFCDSGNSSIFCMTTLRGLNIDATHHGNISRFVNHMCDPNLAMVEVLCEEHICLPRAALFALRDIKAGEALGFNYWPEMIGDTRKSKRTSTRCTCASPNCYKYLPTSDK